MIRIAAIGDIHTCLDLDDVVLFNQSDYDLMLICGDLPGRSHKQTVNMGRILSGLKKPALLVPGNHDSTSVLQLLGEITGSTRLKMQDSAGIQKMQMRVDELRSALGDVQMGGYSCHSFGLDQGWNAEEPELDIIVGRPHSMGGPGIGFLPYIEHVFGVSNLDESARLMQSLFAESRAPLRLVLAHNGPNGLGNRPSDIWGCDFDPDRGDFGDPDLGAAIEWAVLNGCGPSVVVAGHMHHAVKGGGQREWYIEKHGIHYVNAARVPRIYREAGQKRRHHIRIELDSTGATVQQIIW